MQQLGRRTNRLVLTFRPWIWARTTVYEYFSMSWATRVAAEATDHAPLAARLVGESFELAIKVLNILSRGPGTKLKHGHSLTGVLADMPILEQLLRRLWGSDLDYVISIMDGECNPSQVRYGASGGSTSKGADILPSGYAESADVWTSTTRQLYEELMLSLGRAIWSNYPDGDRNGNPVERHIRIDPAIGTIDSPRPMSEREEAELEETSGTWDPEVWALIVKAESSNVEVPYWGIIPLERLDDPDEIEHYVRARVGGNMTIDVEVKRSAKGFSVGGCRISGREDGEVRLTLHTAIALLPNRAEHILA